MATAGKVSIYHGGRFFQQCVLVRDNRWFGMTRLYLDSLEEPVFQTVV